MARSLAASLSASRPLIIILFARASLLRCETSGRRAARTSSHNTTCAAHLAFSNLTQHTANTAERYMYGTPQHQYNSIHSAPIFRSIIFQR